MRNMAYAVTISKVDDIEGKDKIGLLHFKENAYTVIGSKKLKPGDVVCYFEVVYKKIFYVIKKLRNSIRNFCRVHFKYPFV